MSETMQNNTEAVSNEGGDSVDQTTPSDTSAQNNVEQTTTSNTQTNGSDQTVDNNIQDNVNQETTGDTTTDQTDGADAGIVNSPDDYQVPDYVTPEMKQFAFQQGLSNEQFNSVIAQYGYIAQASEQQRINQLNNMAAAQLEKWGEAAEYNLGLAKHALKTVDKEGELSRVLKETGYGNHPVVLRFLYNLGNQLKEGGFLRGSINKPTGKKSIAEIMYGETHPVKD
jgi:hypothetical protein